MALADIKQSFVDYSLGDNPVRLYALTQVDSAYITERFGNDFVRLIGSLDAVQKQGLSDQAVTEKMFEITIANINLIACIIATSAHEKEAEENVKTLGLIQVIEMFTEVLKVTGGK